MTSDDLGSFRFADYERAARRRQDRDWLTRRWNGGRASVVCIDSGRVEVEVNEGGPSVVWRPTSEVGSVPEADWLLLAERSDGHAFFAMQTPLASESSLSLRDLIVLVGDRRDSSVQVLVRAVGVLNWHEAHHWCPRCGAATELDDAGWMRRCAREGSKHFPRVDPAVIMLVKDDQGRALLGRQSRWPTGWFSTLAGFVEPGETFEEAVARETREEAGVAVTRTRYFGSQSWPFPSSLMVGFRAWTDDRQPARPDGKELVEARWFSRDDLVQACGSGDVSLPPRTSISRMLVEDWYGNQLPGRWSRG
jgi:NAD+ diphosphatase